MVSKVQLSPRWLQNTPSMSNGVALKRSATAGTSDGATNRNTAFGSTKRRISHGQAMRSIFGRARVTQTVRPASSRGGIFSVFTSGAPCLAPGFKAAFERLGARALVAQPGGDALAELQALLADDDDALAGEVGGPVRNGPEIAPCAPGRRRGSASKSSGTRTSMMVGAVGQADETRKLL